MEIMDYWDVCTLSILLYIINWYFVYVNINEVFKFYKIVILKKFFIIYFEMYCKLEDVLGFLFNNNWILFCC